MWGTYCCKNNTESRAIDHLKECDGSSISMDSLCCQNDEYIRCPSNEGCTGSRGNNCYTNFRSLNSCEIIP